VGAGIAAVGVLVFAVLTAYHTIGGGALTEPYGDLVIFFVPPMFVIVGVVVVLIGMYFQWDPVADAQAAVVRALPQVGPEPGRRKEGTFGRWNRSGNPLDSSYLRRATGLCLHGRGVILRRVLPLHDARVH